MKQLLFVMVGLGLSSCVLTDSGMVEYQIVGNKGFTAKYIDKGGIFRDTVVTKEQFTYKFTGENGDEVGASAVSTKVDGGVLIKVRYRGVLVAEGGATKPYEPALAFSILK
jgi:hypothetical protein